MKPAGGLVFITGPMGSGKSYKAVKEIASALMAGKYVITNIQFRDGWEESVARHTPQTFFGANRISYHKRAQLYKSLYIYEEELPEAMRYNPPPGMKEGRALFVWDESHNEIGHRTWMDENREIINKWATQFRKLGFIGYAISQNKDNTDAVWKRIANYEVRLRNQREIVRIAGLRVCPIPFFLALWLPANTPIMRSDRRKGQTTTVLHIERYFLGWERRLYATLGLFSNLENELETFGNRIHLPKAGEWNGIKPARKSVEETLPDDFIIIGDGK